MVKKVDWIKQIENWQRSELSQAAYCRQHHLSYHSFTVQLSAYRKLAKSTQPTAAAESQPALIPVQVEHESSTASASSVLAASSASTAETITLALIPTQGHRLELPMAVSARWVAELLRCLA